MTAQDFTQAGYRLCSELDELLARTEDVGQLALATQEADDIAAILTENAERGRARLSDLL